MRAISTFMFLMAVPCVVLGVVELLEARTLGAEIEGLTLVGGPDPIDSRNRRGVLGLGLGLGLLVGGVAVRVAKTKP